MTQAQVKEIERLYLEMYDMMMAYARSNLNEELLAEEAVQETFKIACQKPKQLLESENPKGWLVNTLKYVLRNVQRSQESAQRLLSRYLLSQSTNAVFSEDKVHLEILYDDVADSEEFQLLKAMFINGNSHLEIAKSKGISLSACKKRIQRAKEKLKKKLKE